MSESKEPKYNPNRWILGGFCFYCLEPFEVRRAGKEARHVTTKIPMDECPRKLSKHVKRLPIKVSGRKA